MNPSKNDAPASDGLAEAKPKVRRRPHTPAVVRAPRTKVISREEFEQIVSTIEMIAHRGDSHRMPGPDTENGGLTGDGTQSKAD